ncbi:MAG: hypothetical protein ACE5H8_02110 [Alphaproteobacteria bacterium]
MTTASQVSPDVLRRIRATLDRESGILADIGALLTPFAAVESFVARSNDAFSGLRFVARDSFDDLERIAGTTFGRLERIMTGALATGKFAWRDLARTALDAIRDILSAQLDAAGVFSGAGGGLFGGGTFNPVLSLLGGIGSLFGGGGFLDSAATRTSLPGGIGGFAKGGPVAAGRPILVGEAGPELFVPPGQGEILPNERLSGPGGRPSVINQKFVMNVSPGVPEAVRAAILRLKPQIQRWAVEAVVTSAIRGGAVARMPRI